jgi:hypothetical protein
VQRVEIAVRIILEELKYGRFSRHELELIRIFAEKIINEADCCRCF